MVMVSAVVHGFVAIGLVWGPTWIPRRPVTPVYEVQLVSLPVEAPRPKPEAPEVKPAPPVPKPVKAAPPKPKAKPVKKTDPGVMKPTKKGPEPVPAPVPEIADEPGPPEPPVNESRPPPPNRVAKTTQPAEPGIQLVTPLMEAMALKYPLYMKVLTRKITENWSPPGAGFAKANEALVVFTILRDGSVRGAEIEQGSGDDFYDRAALRAVQRASPFPSLPDGYPDDTLKIYFSFSLAPDRMS